MLLLQHHEKRKNGEGHAQDEEREADAGFELKVDWRGEEDVADQVALRRLRAGGYHECARLRSMHFITLRRLRAGGQPHTLALDHDRASQQTVLLSVLLPVQHVSLSGFITTQQRTSSPASARLSVLLRS